MRRTILAGVAALAVGCASGGEGGGEDLVEFQADVEGSPGYTQLDGSARAIASLGSTLVTMGLDGAEPGAVHPWHVHEGRCGSGGGIVGAAGAYSALEIDSDGGDRQTARIDVQLEDDRDYHVNVHLSPQDPGTIVACGALVD